MPLAHREFERHARLAPNRTALTIGAERRTYGELNAAANRFAHHLLALGMGRGAVVGVCLDRSVDLVVSILGILKAGAAYVPLDPTYPVERLGLMGRQLDTLAAVVANDDTADLVATMRAPVINPAILPPVLAAYPNADPEVLLSGDDLCYVVFTSGSTGTPKATAVRHRGWYNLLNWLTLEYGLDETSANLLVSSFGFDISQRSLMTPLFNGATLHMLPSRFFDVGMAYRAIGALGVKTLHCAPSTLYLLVDREVATGGDALARMDYVFIGGEPLKPARVSAWATRPDNRCVLLHQYGVAECTDVATSHVMADYTAYRSGVVPVGTPVYNTRVHVLDDDLHELDTGEVGEICISGASVGLGYLNPDPHSTCRFVEPVLDGRRVRLYRTGDRGYTTAAGELVVVGRMDSQVKIRGMRIDLNDVEHGVRSNPRVRDAVVLAVAIDPGDPHLVAFVIGQDPVLDPRQLRSELSAVLPLNMIPREFVQLPAFPLNPNGKVDRKLLANAARAGEPVVGTTS
ncbi:amino acid adenylation domain-containing protein [Geodermatophilus sp. URMC 62]|uniref:amino acid adenylation domain-containing protein n=1 Tax=Geodermatophilus sp. URMC 62 TaxID=3423414 RepID=UPI00406C1D72